MSDLTARREPHSEARVPQAMQPAETEEQSNAKRRAHSARRKLLANRKSFYLLAAVLLLGLLFFGIAVDRPSP